MLTIDQGLDIACQPALEGVGRKPLPMDYFGTLDAFAISDEYLKTVRKIIGEVNPTWRPGTVESQR